MKRKIFSTMAVALFMSSSLNINAEALLPAANEEISCLKGAHLAANALATAFDLSYELEFALFDSLLQACVLNGGWE